MLADTLAASFETRERQSGGTFHALKDNAPEWVRDAVKEAHQDRFPCDWIYQQCDTIAGEIRQEIFHGDNDPHDIGDYIEIEADIYTASLTAWLADHLDNLNYCNEWAQEFSTGKVELVAMISGGQWLAKREIADAIIQAYREQLEANE